VTVIYIGVLYIYIYIYVFKSDLQNSERISQHNLHYFLKERFICNSHLYCCIIYICIIYINFIYVPHEYVYILVCKLKTQIANSRHD
jgi:hypothetical protein